MRWFRRPKSPVPLLLYLEWVLIAIALLTAFSPLPPAYRPGWMRQEVHSQVRPPDGLPGYGRRRLTGPQHLPRRPGFPAGVAVSIASLGLMGLRLPGRSQKAPIRWLYAGLGFGFSWLAVAFGGQGASFFSALLLVVAIRACLLFPWRGRIVVALLAYGSFLLWAFLRLHGLAHRASDPLHGLILTLTFNSSLLFGLVLVFVLLLVGALLSEQQSRRELAEANRQLREYAILVEDRAILQERNRIAREIHDSVGHNLTAQSIQLENAALFLPENPQRADRHLRQARELGREALKDVRASVATLRSHPLQRSFLPTLSHLIEDFRRTAAIELESHLAVEDTPPTEIAIALYRVVQEALTNIAKHAGATRVRLSLVEESGQFHLKIRDNGCGFNPRENTTGFGLQGMGERIAALDGEFELVSSPGEGCKIEVKLSKNKRHDSSSVG